MFLNKVVNLSELDNNQTLALPQSEANVSNNSENTVIKTERPGFMPKFGAFLAAMFVAPAFVPINEEASSIYYHYCLPPYLV